MAKEKKQNEIQNLINVSNNISNYSKQVKNNFKTNSKVLIFLGYLYNKKHISIYHAELFLSKITLFSLETNKFIKYRKDKYKTLEIILSLRGWFFIKKYGTIQINENYDITDIYMNYKYKWSK
jgi:hypothetical protein